MSRIDIIEIAHTSVEWIQKNQEEIENHPAWHPNITENTAEKILAAQPPFTYLLRPGEKEHTYFISFVELDLSIKHQFFVLELDRKGWRYRNATMDSYPEIKMLIPRIMHCIPSACTHLSA